MNQYTGKDIKVLTDFEHVRLRTPIFFGSLSPTEYVIPLFRTTGFDITPITFVPAVYKAVGEIIDNSLDEFAHLPDLTPRLTISADPDTGTYTIRDNGRGVPIDMHESGEPTPQVIFGSLRSGRNFTDDKPKGVFGMNGVGSSCVVATSTNFEVTILRDGKQYYQTFSNTGSVSTPVITKRSAAAKRAFGSDTGTSVTFSLDPEVFDPVTLPRQLIDNRVTELTLCNPRLTISYNGMLVANPNGFAGLVKRGNWASASINIDTPVVSGQFFLIFDHPQSGVSPRMFTWVNNSYLFEGGKCNTQFLNALVDVLSDRLAAKAKRAGATLVREDIESNLVILANLQIDSPEFDGQNKIRLTGPSLRNEFVDSISQAADSLTRNKLWVDAIIDRAVRRTQLKSQADVTNKFKRTQTKHIEGLLDATAKDRMQCQLLITEGRSAKSQISDARDPETTAAYALTGKINNVYGASAASVLKMGKLTNLLKAIGLVPGQAADPNRLNYGKIVIAADADHDGDDITTLLVNVFYQFWPNLFDPDHPRIYRLTAPNICLVKQQKRLKIRKHFPTRESYEEQKHKFDSSWEVNYYKGLGSMTSKDWEMVLSDPSMLIPVIDDGTLAETLTLLFGKDADERKDLLTS